MRILLVTYSYPPSKSVNGYRPYYFSKALAESGYEVHVLTRHFTGQEKFNESADANRSPFSISREDNVLIFRTPFENAWFGYHKNTWIKKSGLWKIIYLIQLIIGRTTQESYNAWFKPYLRKLFSEYPYGLVLVESGPTNLVHVVSKESLRYKVSYAIDFRDAYYHEMYLKNQQTLPFNKKLKIFLERHYMNRSIQNSFFCISISDSLHDILEVPKEKREIVVNGYDEQAWSSIGIAKPSGEFKIVIGGKLYEREFLQPFLQSIFLFLGKDLPNVKVLFIAPGDSSVLEIIQSRLPFSSVQILKDRISYEETLGELASAQVLMYHGWRGYRGIPGTKIYDYVRSGKHILIVPGDHDIIDRLILDTRRGISLDDPKEAAEQLTHWYQDWLGGKNTMPEIGYSQSVHNYSREYQNGLLCKILAKRLETR